jgi:hypothetical protein
MKKLIWLAILLPMLALAQEPVEDSGPDSWYIILTLVTGPDENGLYQKTIKEVLLRQCLVDECCERTKDLVVKFVEQEAEKLGLDEEYTTYTMKCETR